MERAQRGGGVVSQRVAHKEDPAFICALLLSYYCHCEEEPLVSS